MTAYTHKEGRVWFQFEKFVPYKLYLLAGATDLTDPKGTLSPSREPSPGARRVSVVTDMLRADPDLPSFTIETRLQKTKNWLLALQCSANVQMHMGRCDRPDNYYKSNMAWAYGSAERENISADRAALIEGDDAKVAISVPFKARNGPAYVDFLVSFLSARTIAAIEDIMDIAFLGTECLEDCMTQRAAGEIGYAVTDAYAGSPTDAAAVYYSTDHGEMWAITSEDPFGPGESISCVVLLGISNDHRVIVSRGTADGGNPAEIAYADVTAAGTTDWVNVDVGAVDGQFINYMYWLDYGSLYAVTNDGYIYKSDDGGVSWTAKYTAGVVDFNDVVALGPGTDRQGYVWAVGDSNMIRLSKDEGTSWSTVTGPTGGAGDTINTVAATPDGTVFIGNDAGEIYGSFDNGENWTTLSLQGLTVASAVRIRAASDDVIWAIGTLADGTSRAWRSTDGGASFRLWDLSMPVNSGLNALAVIDINYVFVAGDQHPGGGTAFISKTLSDLATLP